jgi:hypothetical protein
MFTIPTPPVRKGKQTIIDEKKGGGGGGQKGNPLLLSINGTVL